MKNRSVHWGRGTPSGPSYEPPPLPIPLLHCEWRRGCPKGGRGGAHWFMVPRREIRFVETLHEPLSKPSGFWSAPVLWRFSISLVEFQKRQRTAALQDAVATT